MDVGSVGFELTDRCDLACAHCLRAVVPPHAQRARDIELGLVERVVGEARKLGIPHVGLTGGEPTLHPHFLQVVDAIVGHGLSYNFVSNGLGLPELIPRWAARPERRQGLRDITVSLDGATEATHDGIRGRGTFRRTLAGIAVLRATGVPFNISMCITRTNRHQIDQMGLFAHHLGAQRLYLTHFLPNGRPHATQDLDLTTDERHQVEAVIKRLIDAMRFPIFVGEGYYTTETDHQCATVRLRTLNVDPSGHVTFCCELSNYYGEARPPETRSDWICDLARVSLEEAIALQRAAIARFRGERLEDEAAGRRGEDDKFACRYCVRHFGKPEREVVPVQKLRTRGRADLIC
ncbi:MAG TPA: radical SAM protein [Polyangia bacterium]|nr:radical SAM protein [Polyangia bacterium]